MKRQAPSPSTDEQQLSAEPAVVGRMQTTPSLQRQPTQRTTGPEPSPKSAAALALSILCQQHQVPHPQASPVASSMASSSVGRPSSVYSLYSSRPTSSSLSYLPYSPYHQRAYPTEDRESPFKRLKPSYDASPRYLREHHAMYPPPQYAPSPYTRWGDGSYNDERLQMFVEASRAFAQYPSPYYDRAQPPPPPPPVRASPSLVTPTPKKHSYSRKNKSLGLLCENFIETYENSSAEISIDNAAKALGVERRRIYDIVNILESLSIVTRKCKNTYDYKGMDHLPDFFGKLQQEAFENFELDAVEHGLIPSNGKTQVRNPDKQQKKSLGRLTLQFLQLFLAGHLVISLTDASDKILGASSLVELAAMAKETNVQDPLALQAAATRGLKTKIRRLYDIANVLQSLNLVQKLESESRKCKPTFQWTFGKSAEEIRDQYKKSSSTETRASETCVMASTVATPNAVNATTVATSNSVDATAVATPNTTSFGSPSFAQKVPAKEVINGSTPGMQDTKVDKNLSANIDDMEENSTKSPLMSDKKLMANINATGARFTSSEPPFVRTVSISPVEQC